MINLRNSPFLWFALILLAAFGLVEETFLTLPNEISLTFAFVCLLSAFFAILRYQPGHQVRSTFFIGILLTLAGILRITQFQTSLFPDIPLDGPSPMSGVLEITQVLKVKEIGVSLKCRVMAMTSINDDSIQLYTDKFILVQIKEVDSIRLFPNDRIEISGWVSAIKGPLNPHAFDIRKYYRSIGIRHQFYCKGEDMQILPKSQNSVMRITAMWQSNLSEIVKQYTSPEVAQLTNALVWGDRSDMNAEVRDAFADSGAMHVLSVSGMHMAIVYSMLFVLLGAPGNGTYPRRIFRFICYTVAILLYMGLTGACPAVVRSGLMILLYLLGKAMGWNTPIWNLLGFAGFVMLWINPYVYINIGFQLSFLAMGGILLYAQPMIRFLTFKNKIIHGIWEITAVSVAAQVFILPSLLSQFHQFPLTFVASSLVAMPASYVIIFGALLNVILWLFGINWGWIWFDKAAEYFILSMKWMASLNPAMNFSLPPLGSLFLLLMAILFSVALVYRWSSGKKYAYILGIAAFINLGSHRTKQWAADDLVVYHQYQGLLLDVIIDGRCYSIQDSAVSSTGIEFAARGYRCHRDVIQTININKKENFISENLVFNFSFFHFGKSTFLIWDDHEVAEAVPSSVSHLLVDQCENLNVLKEYICAQSNLVVILPGHLQRNLKNRLLKFLKENNINHFDIGTQGYFKLEV